MSKFFKLESYLNSNECLICIDNVQVHNITLMKAVIRLRDFLAMEMELGWLFPFLRASRVSWKATPRGSADRCIVARLTAALSTRWNDDTIKHFMSLLLFTSKREFWWQGNVEQRAAEAIVTCDSFNAVFENLLFTYVYYNEPPFVRASRGRERRMNIYVAGWMWQRVAYLFR